MTAESKMRFATYGEVREVKTDKELGKMCIVVFEGLARPDMEITVPATELEEQGIATTVDSGFTAVVCMDAGKPEDIMPVRFQRLPEASKD